MGYPNHARIEREVAVNAEVERCASIMKAVGLETVSVRGDRDGYIVELVRIETLHRSRFTRGFGLTICEAFAKAAEEHRQ